MSLSINAPEWNPATNQSKGNGNIRTQENTGEGQSHRGKSKDGSVSHSHRGGGRNRRGGGPIESSNNNPNSHHHHHHQQSYPSQRGRGGGSRGGGGGGGSHRGGSRGGSRSSSSHVYDDAHPIVSDEISDADALAIAAALSEDHAPSAPPVMPNATRSSSQSSSHHSHSHSHTPSPADILGFKFERTTLQETRFLNRPRSFPKGKPSEVFNKNQYMQANHFFILGEDDPASFLLPDHPLDWSKVELVICPVDNEARVCPICLEPPTAATITKCGHVFCMTCMLQYFAQSQRSWSKCPLCHDSVYPQSLKSAEFRVHPKVREGDTIEFMLMCRSKDSVNASPLMESLSSEEQSYFTRMRRTHDISAIVQRELRQLFQLRDLSRSTNDTTPLPFIDQAEANIVKRITAWSDAHPYWKMKSPTYEEMKEAENHKYAEEEIERRRRAERATSILARTEEWPELPKSNRPLSRTNSTAAQSAATSTQQQSAVPYTPSPVPRPISTLSASPSSSSLTSAPTSTSATSNLPPSSTSSSGSSSPSFTSSTPSTPIQTPTPSHIPKPYRAGQQQQQQHQQHQSQQSPSLQPNLNQQQHQSDMYYFYQSSDGQQLYLHSLNFRSLLLTHGNDVHSLPSRIRGKVVHRDTYLMDSNVRSKFRFLSHLPLTASFALTLVDFDSSHPPSFVSKEAQAQLASEFAADRKARQLAAKKQRELNKRSIMTSKAAAMGDQDETTKSGNSNGSMSFANWQLDAASAASFPDLHNPLGLASAAPLPPPVATASPDLRPNNWNIVASKGLASSELWPSLAEAAAGGAGATPTSTPASASASSSNSGGSGSHWGASSGPLTIGRPTPIWGKTNSASSSNSNKSTGDAESANEEDQLPPSFQNRKGQNVILASGSRRAYK